MSTSNNYPEYAAIEHHIHRAKIARVPAIAEAIAGFVVMCWNEIKAPPAPAAVIIELRRSSSGYERRLGLQR
jgi:hypothetical protein